MVGAGVRMGWYIQEVPSGTSSYVVACKSCSSFSLQVIRLWLILYDDLMFFLYAVLIVGRVIPGFR